MECRQHVHYHFNALQLHERTGHFPRQKVHSRPNVCSSPSALQPNSQHYCCWHARKSLQRAILSLLRWSERGGLRERSGGGGEENKKKNNKKKKKRWQFDPVDCVSGTGTQTRPTCVSPRTGGRRKEPGMLQGLVYAN